MKRKKKAGTIGYVIFLSLFLFVMIAPMLYMFKSD